MLPTETPVKEATVTLYFQGHYVEPPLSLVVPLADGKEKTFALEFDPMKADKKSWDSAVNITK